MTAQGCIRVLWIICFLFVSQFSFKSFSQEDEPYDTKKINIMVIDGDNPDLNHPWYLDNDARSVIHPVDPLYIHEGQPFGMDPDQSKLPHMQKLSQEQVLNHWSARFSLGWTDSTVGKLVNRLLQWKTFAKISIVAGMALQFYTNPEMGWYDNITGGAGEAWSIFYKGWMAKAMIPFAPHLVYLVTYPYWRYKSKTPGGVDPQYNVPRIVYRSMNIKHATHVSGTLSGNTSEAAQQAKTDLVIHTLSFEELGLSEEAFKIGPLRQLKKQAQTVLDSQSGPRSAASKEAVREFLEGFFGIQKLYFKKLVTYINDNDIRSVNMSYGADAFGIRKGLAQYFSMRDGLTIPGAEKVSEYLARLQNASYVYLFKNCPKTKFFVAAGNDASPVHRSQELFTSIDEPNVFVSGAADDHLRMAFFSNYSETLTDSFGYGVDQNSALPKNRTGGLSGTSMASPYNMALDLLLTRIDPDLTVQESFEILRAGSIKVAELSSAANSRGVSMPSLIIAHYLFRKLKEEGHLADIDDLAPILVVHGLEKPKKKLGRKLTGPESIRKAIWDQNEAVIKHASVEIKTGTANWTENIPLIHEPHEKVHSELAILAESAVGRLTNNLESSVTRVNPLKYISEVIEILSSYRYLLRTGNTETDTERVVSDALAQLNDGLMRSQQPLVEYFATPSDKVIPGTRFSELSLEGRLPITWAMFRTKILTPESMSHKEVLFEITQFLKHGQPLTKPQSQEIIDMLRAYNHRVGAVLFVLQNILKYHGHDFEIDHPYTGEKIKVSDYMKRSLDAFPDPGWNACGTT
jgi:hypothetical protein